MGLLESASLSTEMFTEVRLPISRSSRISRKNDPHWELPLLLYNFNIYQR